MNPRNSWKNLYIKEAYFKKRLICIKKEKNKRKKIYKN